MMDKTFPLVSRILGFEPMINNQYSWLNSLTDLGISWITHIILNLTVLFIAIFIYDFIRSKGLMGKPDYWMFCFLFAGLICSLIDKIAWGGSLDYMNLMGLFIVDLKDGYLTAFEIILIAKFIFQKEFRNTKTKVVLYNMREYFKLKYIRKSQ